MRIAEFSKPIDELDTDTLVLTVMSGEKPPKEIAGLVDWRLHGAISRALKNGFLTGTSGEFTLLPVKTRFGARRILIAGVGKGTQWNRETARNLGTKVAKTLADLDVHEAAIWCHRVADETDSSTTRKEFLRGFENQGKDSDIHLAWVDSAIMRYS